MGREQFKTADEDVAAEFERVCHLFQMALGRPSDRMLFESLMTEASERGLTWVEGLEYVLEHRGESAGVAGPQLARKGVGSVSSVDVLAMRKAG